ncbi:MAG: PAS domain S-box protein, partial [Rhodospirillaceae bacterium]
MIALDTNTVIISSSAINICVGLILLAFIRARDNIQLHWCAVAISYGVAGLLIGFRDLLPPWLANVTANALIGLSVVLIHRGAWLMVGRRPPDRLYAASLLVLAAVFYQFTYATPDVGIRLFAVSIFRIPYFVSAAIVLHSSRQFHGLAGTKALTGLLFAGACWYAFRGGLALSSDTWAVYLRTGSMQSINFLVAAVINVMMAVTLFRVDAEQAVRRASDLAVELKNQLDRLREVTVSRDLLEAETAERRISEAKYRRLYESLRDAVVTSDVAGRLVEWNGVFRDLLGYSDEDLSKMTLDHLMPER